MFVHITPEIADAEFAPDGDGGPICEDRRPTKRQGVGMKKRQGHIHGILRFHIQNDLSVQIPASYQPAVFDDRGLRHAAGSAGGEYIGDGIRRPDSGGGGRVMGGSVFSGGVEIYKTVRSRLFDLCRPDNKAFDRAAKPNRR